MTLADLLSDLRYLCDHDLARAVDVSDYGVALEALGWICRIDGRLRLTDAGFGVLEACADVVIEAD